jgi:hypothetical protein
MDNTLVPTYLEVKCLCKRTVNIRTRVINHTVTCWHCMRKINVHLGNGKGNIRVSIEGRNVIPSSVIQ